MRWPCICCALPQRVLEHVARKTGRDRAARLAENGAHSNDVRVQRSVHLAASTAAPGGHRRRIIHDADHRFAPLPGRRVRSEGERAVADAAVNGAYDNIGATLDFFSQVFNRDSLDGKGMDVIASVHYGDAWPNAMWNGTEMLFGDGDEHVGSFTKSLDIVAHELTHAVTHHSIRGGLGVVHVGGKPALAGEAGALNESISDVFASLVKQWHSQQQAKDADWLVGEGVLARGLGHAVRSLKHPGNGRETYEDDDQVADMAGYADGADVHRNSGIPNHAFYLAAMAIGGNAWEGAGRIWYESIGLLHMNAKFRDAADATVSTASRLFGASSKQQHAVREAWQKVGVLRA